jgi:hypothetical protein
MAETATTKRVNLAKLQAAGIQRCDWREFFESVNDEGATVPMEDAATLDAYFRIFAKPDDGKCLNCGLVQGGLIAALLGGFRWGLAHGEGFCSRCKYPARACHYDIGPVKRFNAILQYHPDELKERTSDNG